ncbi:MAG: hypothetical protein QOI66_5491 [Myxococcales bacterium]|jgi:hypothetical protein|nr:hypothetical protein [Myxococcales bacterium]
MPRFLFSLLVVAAATLTACSTGFRRAQLQPVAQIDSVDRPYVGRPYAQVREVGVVAWGRWFWSEDSSQTAVTVDLRNDSSSPLTIDVGSATINYQPLNGADAVQSPAVAAGSGGLPALVNLANATPHPVTLAPGESQTLWIAFGRIFWPGRSRETLRLTTTAGEPIRVTLFDPTSDRPRWRFAPESRSGTTMRIESQFFGNQGYGGTLGAGVWFVRGRFRLDLGYCFGLTYAQGVDGLARAFTVGFGPSLAWHPLRGASGIYGSGSFSFADFAQQSGVQDRNWSPSVSIGIESGSQTVVPTMFYRLGYVHVFDSGVARRDGLIFAVGWNAWLW